MFKKECEDIEKEYRVLREKLEKQGNTLTQKELEDYKGLLNEDIKFINTWGNKEQKELLQVLVLLLAKILITKV